MGEGETDNLPGCFFFFAITKYSCFQRFRDGHKSCLSRNFRFFVLMVTFFTKSRFLQKWKNLRHSAGLQEPQMAYGGFRLVIPHLGQNHLSTIPLLPSCMYSGHIHAFVCHFASYTPATYGPRRRMTGERFGSLVQAAESGAEKLASCVQSTAEEPTSNSRARHRQHCKRDVSSPQGNGRRLGSCL
ncbi:hypothetical protein GOODEAATRI_032310 [Goodea atripinnis]|uniref:Uncharacterized protein n=1 Tax=Goodea atripinnis TaxID=208336 RepID=A0ABV0N688_9TELE